MISLVPIKAAPRHPISILKATALLSSLAFFPSSAQESVLRGEVEKRLLNGTNSGFEVEQRVILKQDKSFFSSPKVKAIRNIGMADVPLRNVFEGREYELLTNGGLNPRAAGEDFARFICNSKLSPEVVQLKCIAILLYGDGSIANKKYNLSVFHGINRKSYKHFRGADFRLAVAIFESNDELAGEAIDIIAGSESDVRAALGLARDGFKDVREVIQRAGRNPLELVLLSNDPVIKQLRSSDLSKLYKEFVEGRKSKQDIEREKLIEEKWAAYSQKVRGNFLERVTRQPLNRDNATAHPVYTTGIWGNKIGTYSQDLIPEGARVTGIRVVYSDFINAVQLLYEGRSELHASVKPSSAPPSNYRFEFSNAGTYKSVTPWRGKPNGKTDETLALGSDEVITEFKAYGFNERITALRIITNKRSVNFTTGGVVINDWGRAVDNGRAINGTVELALPSNPAAVGIVTYADESLRGFGLIIQEAPFLGGRQLTRDDIARTIE